MKSLYSIIITLLFHQAYSQVTTEDFQALSTFIQNADPNFQSDLLSEDGWKLFADGDPGTPTLNDVNDTWEGLTVTDGRIVEIVLEGKQLGVDANPDGLHYLVLDGFTALDKADFSDNNFDTYYLNNLPLLRVLSVGNNILEKYYDVNSDLVVNGLDPALGSFTSLTQLDLSFNQLGGGIPSELGSLSLLQFLFLDENELSGTVPDSFAGLSHLWVFQLTNNQISGLPDLSELPLIAFRVDQNKLELDDLVANEEVITNYSDQEQITYNGLLDLSITADDIGSGFTIDFNDENAPIVEGMEYRWYKDGVPFATTGTAELQLSSISSADEGQYYCLLFHPSLNEALVLSEKLYQSNVISVQINIGQTEFEALFDFYKDMSTSRDWISKTGWEYFDGFETFDAILLEEVTPRVTSEWTGLTLSGGRVIKIELSDNDLSSSTLSPALAELTGLEVIRLTNQSPLEESLSGLQSISPPSAWSSLTSLEILDLSGNAVNEEISVTFGALVSLQTLDISGNQLYGEIPAEIGDLINLAELYLDNKEETTSALTGAVPESFTQLTMLKKLNVSNHQLETLPNLSDLPLVAFDVSGNYLNLENLLINKDVLTVYENQTVQNVYEVLGELAQDIEQGPTAVVSLEVADPIDFEDVQYQWFEAGSETGLNSISSNSAFDWLVFEVDADQTYSVSATISHTDLPDVSYNTSSYIINVSPAVLPAATAVSPAHQSEDVSLSIGQLSLTFDQKIQLAMGSLLIKRIEDHSVLEEIDISGSQVRLEESQLEISITLNSTLESSTEYYVELESGAILDLVGNSFAGYSGTAGWSFVAEDVIAPVIVSTTPTSASTEIASSSLILAVVFDEDLVLGAGKINIIQASDNKVSQSIDVSDVSIAGAQVSIPLSQALSSGTKYYITIEPGSFKDLAGNEFSGIDDVKTWTFETASEQTTSVLALESNVGKNQITIYPNPFVQNFTIAVANKVSEEMRYALTSMSGHIIEQEVLVLNQGIATVNLKTTLSKGSYILSVQMGESRSTYHIIQE